MTRIKDAEFQTKLKSFGLLAPRLGKLLYRLVRDPRVPRRSKAVFLFVSGYLISPLNFIPNFIPVVGEVEDIILAAVALDAMINHIPEEIVREHWDGEGDAIETIQEVIAIGASFLPRKLRSKLRA